MSCVSQNFHLFHVANLSVLNFRIFLLMYPGSVSSHDPATPFLRIISQLHSAAFTTVRTAAAAFRAGRC